MPVHNRKAITLQCLRSISRVDRTGLDIRTIVVDDASTDGTYEAVREQFPEVELIRGSGDLWYTAGTNRGIEAAMVHDPDFVLCCNDDSIFDEKAIKAMVDCALMFSRTVVGALLLRWDKPHCVRQVAPQWKFWNGGFRHWRKQTVWTVPADPWEVELIVGNCVLYPAGAIAEVGLMDEKRLVQYGDAEYTPRMRRRGWRLMIEPRARVFCMPNEAPRRLREMTVSEKVSAVFTHSGNAHSIHRRYHMSLGSAPNKLLGLLALPVFFVRLLLGRNVEGEWADRQPEKPLSEVFANAVRPRT